MPKGKLTLTIGVFLDGTGNNADNTAASLDACSGEHFGMNNADAQSAYFQCVQLKSGHSGFAAGSHLGYYTNVHWLNTLYSTNPAIIGYYDNIQIGLAPGGKVAVWLRGIGSQPNYRVTPSVLKTVSGDKLELCKGITKSDFSYRYDKDIIDFIKGKAYPYGNW